MKTFVELTKPRLTLMALATAFAGFFMGHEGPLEWAPVLKAMGGVLLIGASVNALNQVAERDLDKFMKRTQPRPLPSGRLSPENALVFGVVLLAAGLAWLFLLTNRLTALLGLSTAVSYLLVYTPLKRVTPWNTVAGALPGALPVLMGYAASAGRIDARSLSYFIFLFVWQLPHFFAIAWIYREDYARAGFNMITKGDADGSRTFFWMFVTTFAAVAASFLPFVFGAAGLTYLFIAIFSGTMWIGLGSYIFCRHFAEARKFVVASIAYLFFINIMLIVDRI